MSIPRSMPACLIVLVVATFMSSDEACAQFRWRGQPLPETRHFLITEWAVYLEEGGFLKGDLGFMTNVSRRSACGGSLIGTGGGDLGGETGAYSAFGISGRYRYWFSRNWSFDFAPQVQWVNGNEAYEEWSGTSFGATGTINLGDLIGLALAVNSYEKRDARLSIGLRFGSYPGGLIWFGLIVAGINALME